MAKLRLWNGNCSVECNQHWIRRIPVGIKRGRVILLSERNLFLLLPVCPNGKTETNADSELPSQVKQMCKQCMGAKFLQQNFTGKNGKAHRQAGRNDCFTRFYFSNGEPCWMWHHFLMGCLLGSAGVAFNCSHAHHRSIPWRSCPVVLQVLM